MNGRATPAEARTGKESERSALQALASQVYSRLLRLYPRLFRSDFGGEMQHVFELVLADAGRKGAWGIAGVLLKEIRDLPLAVILQHVHERRKRMMKLLRFETLGDISKIRWTARLLSLIYAGVATWIIISHLLGRAIILPTTWVFAAATLFMLMAWRWERIGGLLAMIASPFALGSVVLIATQPQAFGLTSTAGPLVVSVVGLGFALSTLIAGWLFVSVAEYRVVEDPEATGARRPALKWILIGAAIVLLVIILLAITLLSPAFMDMESSISSGLVGAIG